MAEFTQAAQESGGVSDSSKPDAGTSAPKAEVHINSDEISAVLAQSLGNAPAVGGLSPDTNVGSGAPTIKDQQVSFDGDVFHGQFPTAISARDVWLPTSPHLA